MKGKIRMIFLEMSKKIKICEAAKLAGLEIGKNPHEIKFYADNLDEILEFLFDLGFSNLKFEEFAEDLENFIQDYRFSKRRYPSSSSEGYYEVRYDQDNRFGVFFIGEDSTKWLFDAYEGN